MTVIYNGSSYGVALSPSNTSFWSVRDVPTTVNPYSYVAPVKISSGSEMDIWEKVEPLGLISGNLTSDATLVKKLKAGKSLAHKGGPASTTMLS